MPTQSPIKVKVDTYIACAPAFAKPICKKLRQTIFKAEPRMNEVWKWSFPVYEKNGVVCSYGAFKQHVGLWFFKGASLKDPKKLFVKEDVSAKSMRKINFTDVKQVDDKALVSYIKEAIAVNVKGTKKEEPKLTIPKDLKQLFEKSNKAKEFFDTLSYTNKKEYVRWIVTAKRHETREARLTNTIQMLTKGIKNP